MGLHMVVTNWQGHLADKNWNFIILKILTEILCGPNLLVSMGTSDIDQVSKIGKLGLIDGNLVIIATKFSFL